MSTTALITVHTVSGRSRRFRSGIDHTRIVGLDFEGRVVVNDFDAFAEGRESKTVTYGSISCTESPFLFGLTLCCNASDKGCEDGVFCRACYGAKPNADEGFYLFMAADRTYPDLDPADWIDVGFGKAAVRFAPVIPADAIAGPVETRPVPDFATQLADAGL